MSEYNIYQDIATRSDGDVYIGVVGPVRTGKSTFIKRFMEQLVIPNISDNYRRERTIDELPQSSAGKTIMTTEPKFIPEQGVNIKINGNAGLNVRMIDCVGYIINDAVGYLEDEQPRMVSTPWSDEQMPFTQAAEIGTRKVIAEHSNIGIVVTTDGTITDIPAESYYEAEERVISELKELGKPFIVLLNSAEPDSIFASERKQALMNKYDVKVVSCNCATLSAENVNEIIESVLFEFPLKEIKIHLPDWMDSLEDSHWVNENVTELIVKTLQDIEKVSDVEKVMHHFQHSDCIENYSVQKIDLGVGSVDVKLVAVDGLYYKILGEQSGFEINSQQDLLALIKKLSAIKSEYDKVSYALQEVEQRGYGIVTPTIDQLSMQEPEIVKQGGKFGVRLKASAPSIHMIKADIETEVNPIVGTERQSEELVHYLLEEFENDPSKIWSSNIFGKTLSELVNEGLNNKLYRMSPDAQLKLQETLQKIVNEGSGGLICIIL
ncbi:MAG: stage IV sporulation protein A [Clostridia bacterium]|nr:stage IV sporulation protein A [Clostridia bacterium]